MDQVGQSLDRVHAAIAGDLDPAQLTPMERPYYYDLLDEVMAQPGPSRALRPGDVGDDDSGRLVRVRDDGTMERLKEER